MLTVCGTKYEARANGTFRHDIRLVGTPAGGVVSRTERTEQLFSWGYSVVSEGPAGKQTAYTYYTDRSQPRIASVTSPDGSSVAYEYDANGEIIKTTETTGTTSKVTLTTRSVAPDTTGGEITTTETRVGTTLISKNQSLNYPGVSTSDANSPASYSTWSKRFDENNQEYVTTSDYVKMTALNGDPTYRLTKQVNPDGTQSRYTYVISGDTETTTQLSGYFGNGNTLLLGTRSVSVVNRQGTQLSSAQYTVDTANNVDVKTAETVSSNFDAFGRPQTTTYLDGSTTTRTYGCCGVASETDRDGVTTTYSYDEFQRLSYTVRDGITTLYSYDAAGNQTSVTVKGRNDGEITTSSAYANGELISTTDALNRTTTQTESYVKDGSTVTYMKTTTRPDNSTEIVTAVNGRQASFGGTAQYGQSYEYGPNWVKVLPQNVTTYTDMLGRTFKTEQADGTYAQNFYNVKNQLIKSVSPAGQVTLYTYDTLGRSTASVIDVNGNGEIDDADLVTSTAYGFGTENGNPVSITTVTRSQGADVAVVSVAKQSLDGLESWSTDLNGRTVHTQQERLGNGQTRQTVTNPDGTKTVTTSQNGRAATVQQFNSDGTNGNLTTYSYDEFDRVIGTVETLGGVTVNTASYTYDANGQVLAQTVNGQTTSFEYDALGRGTKTTNPGNAAVVTEYYPTGSVFKVSGADTYPVEYTYDAQGRRATLKTFKDADTPQVTSWSYNALGQNTMKTYADGSSVQYTYNADGKLLTRTWARTNAASQPLVTTYSYDAMGRQNGVGYSDGTPSLSMTYNVLDQQTSITDAAGVRNFSYDANHRLANETNPVIVNGVVDYTYDTYGRRSAMSLGNGSTVFANAAYTYAPNGRIATVGNGTDTLTYTYVPGTSRIGGTSWANAPALNTSHTYDAHQRLTGIAVNNVPLIGYTLNDKNQRTGATLPDGNNWVYGYDPLGQLTGAAKNSSANALLKNFTYSYDQIGNRLTATEDNATTTYVSNLVNQYTLINAAIPTYDTDGNMLTHNGWTYTYNGENRLIAAENSDTKLEFNYDYMGRRFEKKVYTKGLLSLYDWSLQSHRRYAYDGYKLIAEFDANDNLLLRRREQEYPRGQRQQRRGSGELHLHPLRRGGEPGGRRRKSLPLQQRIPRRRNPSRLLQLGPAERKINR